MRSAQMTEGAAAPARQAMRGTKSIAVLRAMPLSAGATESSMSTIRTSAAAAAALGKRSGRVAGVNSQLRAGNWVTSLPLKPMSLRGARDLGQRRTLFVDGLVQVVRRGAGGGGVAGIVDAA